MNSSRQSRCLLCRLSAVKQHVSRPKRFSTTPVHSARRRPATKSIKAAQLGLLNAIHERLPKLSAADKELLAKKYTPEQLEAIEAGEEAIDTRDLATQGRIRTDPMLIKYLDDFSEFNPVLDRHRNDPPPTSADELRVKSEDEVLDDFINHMVKEMEDEDAEADAEMGPEASVDDQGDEGPEIDANRLNVAKRDVDKLAEPDNDREVSYFDEDKTDPPWTAMAPELPKIEDPSIRYSEGEEEEEEFPMMQRLYQQTGFTAEQIRKFRVKTLIQHRVVNQTHMGKLQSMYTLSVAGDGNGLVGIGEGKSVETEEALRQSRRLAIKNMKPVSRYERRTIYGEVNGKSGAATVNLQSRPPGFGVRCQQYVFEIARCAGITDLAARVTRSRNPMNVAKATIQALRSQRLPEDVARARGRKMVDVRKVYYGGQV
ncbi:MAG: 28S ribosomal protein S5, mitochondrial [Piccolia ochrophora]|nr:MAG: 28S ribosomal protein S5, mitochondrial [Piccolia ochrophora]